jgi:hypothetical protein
MATQSMMMIEAMVNSCGKNQMLSFYLTYKNSSTTVADLVQE